MTEFGSDEDITDVQYEYYLFFHEDRIKERTLELETIFFDQVFVIWLPVIILWSCIYIFFCYMIIKYISRKMLKPINTLTRRIHITVRTIRLLRQAQSKHNLDIEK